MFECITQRTSTSISKCLSKHFSFFIIHPFIHSFSSFLYSHWIQLHSILKFTSILIIYVILTRSSRTAFSVFAGICLFVCLPSLPLFNICGCSVAIIYFLFFLSSIYFAQSFSDWMNWALEASPHCCHFILAVILFHLQNAPVK